MNHADLDRILSLEEDILPSSGFTASVMDAVRREASAPPPIPFPWRRAVPGLAVAGFTLVVVLVTCLMPSARGATAWLVPMMWQSTLVSILDTMIRAGVGWIVLALLMTLVSVMVSVRYASGGGRGIL